MRRSTRGASSPGCSGGRCPKSTSYCHSGSIISTMKSSPRRKMCAS